jgi:hypothetical protein
MASYELFHVIADGASARVRKYVAEHRLPVRFRNLTYPEVEADFRARGGKSAPALWDGTALTEGLEAILARLQALTNIGRADD